MQHTLLDDDMARVDNLRSHGINHLLDLIGAKCGEEKVAFQCLTNNTCSVLVLWESLLDVSGSVDRGRSACNAMCG